VLAPGSEDKPCSEGVVEVSPGLVQGRGADPQAVGAQHAEGDAEQEQQLGLAAGAVGLDPDGVGGCGGVGAGELAVGASSSPWQR